MKKLILLLLSTFIFANILSADVVSNKRKFMFKVQGQTVSAEQLRGHFTLLWFFDTHCPHCKTSLPALKEVLTYVNKKYYEELNVILMSVAPLKDEHREIYFSNIENEGILKGYVADFDMNTYMNVKSTPTMILLDPYLNIVDKIENAVNPVLYKRHIDLIMLRYKKALENN